MRTAIAIIESDLKQRRFIFAAAAVFSLSPFVMRAFMPRWAGNASATIALFGAILAFGFAAAVAFGLGSSMIGTDLSAGRMSFYFSKPVSSVSLWFGKLIGALITIYVSLAIVLVPSLIGAWNYREGEWMRRSTVLNVAVATLPAMLLILHALSTMVRSRSAWIAADAVAIAITAGAVYWIVRPVVEAGATRLFFVVAGSMAVLFQAALVAAGWWHVSRARTDRVANHIELSKFLWFAFAMILAIAGGYVAWVIALPPSRAIIDEVYPAPSGSWVLAVGKTPGRLDYRGQVLVDVVSGRHYRLPAAAHAAAITYSRDGKHVAWTVPTVMSFRNERNEQICSRELESGSILCFSAGTSKFVQMVMSDDGQRIATLDGGVLTVVDAATGNSLGSVRIADRSHRFETGFYFATPDVIRIVNSNDDPKGADPTQPRLNTIAISEFDVRNRNYRQTGTIAVMCRYMWSSASPDGNVIVVETVRPVNPADRLFTADARTGARIASLPGTEHGRRSIILADGSVVSAVPENDKHWYVTRTSIRGDALRRVDLGPVRWAYVAGGTSDHIVVGVTDRDNVHETKFAGWRIAIVNTNNGRVERTIPDIAPVQRQHWYEDDPRTFARSGPRFAAVDAAGHLASVDLNTGEVRAVPR